MVLKMIMTSLCFVAQSLLIFADHLSSFMIVTELLLQGDMPLIEGHVIVVKLINTKVK